MLINKRKRGQYCTFYTPLEAKCSAPMATKFISGWVALGSFEYLEESWFFLRELENKLKGYFFRLDRLILLSEWELEFG